MAKKHQTKNSWNADLYDNSHSFVSQLGEDLVTMLAPEQDEKILDLGCGTGDLAKRLTELGVDVTGIDQSENMIEQAKDKYPDLAFFVRDARNLGYKNEFNAVFSNAVLHWIQPPEQVAANVYDSLKQGGRFVAEFGGEGNVQLVIDEIISQLKHVGIEYRTEQFPWYFPSTGVYASLLEKAGFRVTLVQHFNRPTPLEGKDGLKSWIEMFAGDMFVDIEEDTKEAVITKVTNNLKEVLWINGRWVADYKRIRIIAIKE